MKIAVLADIHSNVYALDAVIADGQRRGVDSMVNLGDVLYGPIAPAATFELLAEYDFMTISGNQDRELCEAATSGQVSNPTIQYVLDNLGAAALDWLGTLPFTAEINGDILACHGTPDDDEVYLLENVESGFPRLRTDDEISGLLGGTPSGIVLCGHSHLPRTVTLSSGQIVVNPGSVGLPAYTDEGICRHSMETFCPHASYAIVEAGQNEGTIQHLKVPYDHRSAAQEAVKHGREDWAHYLSTGRGDDG